MSERVEISDVNSPEVDRLVGEEDAAKLRDDLELIEGVYPEFDSADYLRGEVAPVFFGSALNTFGVKELLDCFVKIAPSPRPVEAVERTVSRRRRMDSPASCSRSTPTWTPNHRSCIAFVKVCSGKFERNVYFRHVRHDKMMRFAAPTAFMAQKKHCRRSISR